MMETILKPPIRFWRCPSCDLVDQTQRADTHTQMHSCPALRGVCVPLVQVSGPDAIPDARQVVVEREDYLGKEQASPVMAIRTERGDGSNDTTVFAPAATIEAEGGS